MDSALLDCGKQGSDHDTVGDAPYEYITLPSTLALGCSQYLYSDGNAVGRKLCSLHDVGALSAMVGNTRDVLSVVSASISREHCCKLQRVNLLEPSPVRLFKS
jgi:hypothetical protein